MTEVATLTAATSGTIIASDNVMTPGELSCGENDEHLNHGLSPCIAERPHFLRYVPRLFRFDDAPLEATGLALDAYAKGAVLMSSMFVGPALLQLATDATEAQCNEEDCDDARIYGMKPSSLLSNIAIASGLIVSFILPLFGAIVDHTPYRRQVGAISALCLTVVKGLEVMVSSRTWFAVAILQVFSGILFMGHICATYAYTSELSTDPSEQTKFNAHYNVIVYISSLAFLVEVLLVAFPIGLGDVGTARVSQIISATTASIFFGFAWRFFRNRPAISHVPQGTTLFMCGFRKIFQTAAIIWSEFPALKWFMLSVILNESAIGALITVATTYMSHFLNMDATEIGVVFLVVLVAGIPGTKLGEHVALRYNPAISVRICIALFIVATAIAALVLTGPEDKQYVVMFGVCWGVGLGWLHPMHSTIFITMIPKGQESELMGMYLFCCQVLSWLPPLLFTALNEAGVEMSFGLASLNVFLFLGLCCLWLMGSYDNAIEHARVRNNAGYMLNTNSNSADAEIDSNGDIALPTIT